MSLRAEIKKLQTLYLKMAVKPELRFDYEAEVDMFAARHNLPLSTAYEMIEEESC